MLLVAEPVGLALQDALADVLEEELRLQVEEHGGEVAVLLQVLASLRVPVGRGGRVLAAFAARVGPYV